PTDPHSGISGGEARDRLLDETAGERRRVSNPQLGTIGLKMGIEAGLGMAFVAGSPAGLTTIKLRPEPAPLCIAIGSLINRKIAEWEQAFVDEMIEAGNDVVPSAGSR
ncbi:hypothetical protein N9F70_00735, partial [bacterium]|nr:hypothetical protein [bacterium]